MCLGITYTMRTAEGGGSQCLHTQGDDVCRSIVECNLQCNEGGGVQIVAILCA